MGLPVVVYTPACFTETVIPRSASLKETPSFSQTIENASQL